MTRIEETKNVENMDQWYQEILSDLQQIEDEMLRLSEICGIIFWILVILDSVFYNNIEFIRYYAIFCLIGFVLLILKDDCG